MELSDPECGLKLFEKGVILLTCREIDESTSHTRVPSTSGYLAENSVDVFLSKKNMDSLRSLSSTAREWFQRGRVRDLFRLVVDDDAHPACKSTRCASGEHVSLGSPTSCGGMSRVTSNQTALGYNISMKAQTREKNLKSNSGESNPSVDQSMSCYSLSGVESFIVRLPLTPQSPFPWPVTMPQFESNISRAFHVLEDIAWEIFIECCNSALELSNVVKMNEAGRVLLQKLYDLRGSEGKTVSPHKSCHCVRYTDSVLFLRNYIGCKSSAVPHTDSGVLTLISFHDIEEIEGLEFLAKTAGRDTTGDDDINSEEVWTPVTSLFAQTGNFKNEQTMKILVMVGETGEAFLRALLPEDFTKVSVSSAALHRVKSKTPRNGEQPRVTTPFQLRIPFELVPGFMGTKSSGLNMIQF